MTRRALLTTLALLAAACDAGGDTAMSGGATPVDHSAMPGAGIDTTGLRALAVPAEHGEGERLFDVSCAPCHGEAALGTPQGPPLVHIYYEPNHHADGAFVSAVSRGVSAHHWGYGDMPPLPTVTIEQTQQIIGYVRWLQREAGVY